jgi:transposase
MARRRRSEWSGRAKLRSPGRPSVGRREEQRLFWVAIAAGCSSEDAAVAAKVSPAVGVRWFREEGGMPPSQLAPSSPRLSERYLSFAEREQIALLRAQGHGVREIARQLARAASTISRELRRNAATRNGGFDYRPTTRAMACGSSGPPPEAGEAGGPCRAAAVRAGAVSRLGRRAKRGYGPRAGRAVERTPARSSAASAVGPSVEPRADCPTSAA